MDEHFERYIIQSDFIRGFDTDRQQHLIDALTYNFVNTSGRVGTFDKGKINNFKSKITEILKDIDLRIKNAASKIEEKIINGEIKTIESIDRFKSGAIQLTDNIKNKLGSIKREKIPQIKAKFSSMLKDIDLKVKSVASKIEEKIINGEIKVVQMGQRFKSGIVQVANNTKNKLGSIKREKIPQIKAKFSSMLKDIDLRIKNVTTKVQEKAINTQIKIIQTGQRFKSGMVQVTNNAKNKVCSIARSAKNKLSSIFKSDEKTRQNKMNEISERRKKIEELKKYRNELLAGKMQVMEAPATGRSRGTLYVWMAAFASMVLMGVMIVMSVLKK